MQLSDPTQAASAPLALQVGQQIYLSGIPGLPAGTYTLLPGHYALLPGAYKVTVAVNQTTATGLSNFAQRDGSCRVLGYGEVANTGFRDSLPSAYIVTPGAVVRQQSQYAETTASQFYASNAVASGIAAPYLPLDAGQLVINATSSLSLPVTAFTFQAKYLGMSAWECPALFTMLPYLEHAFGIYHVMGGLTSISQAMAKVVKSKVGKSYEERR